MAFIIVGGGRVGLRTARTLVEEGFEVTIVERDPQTINRLQKYGFDVIEGNGSDATIIESAGVESAEVVAGLTGDINTNFAACMIGAEYECRTVLRIDEDYREAIYEKYAEEVDEIVYPEQLGATGAKTALLGGNFNLIADLTEELQLFTVTLPPESPMIGERVNDLESNLPTDQARMYAHGRDRNPLTIPLPGTRVEANDHVAIIAARDVVDIVRDALIDDAPA